MTRFPEVEFLLRSTIGELLRAALGAEWQRTLSKSIRKHLTRVSKQARAAREGVPEDPWASAGLTEISAVVQHYLRRKGDFSDLDPDDLLSGLYDLWPTPDECRVDLDRLRRLRDDQAHPGVAPPIASAVKDEAWATIRRLRLSCESIRRRLARAEDEWWPYIERVDCPGVDAWVYQRSIGKPGTAVLMEGNEVEFVVRAINPVGSDEDLEYALCIQPDDGSFSPPEWQPEPHLHARAGPTGRNVHFLVVARSPSVSHGASGWDDAVSFPARVIPKIDGDQSTRG